ALIPIGFTFFVAANAGVTAKAELFAGQKIARGELDRAPQHPAKVPGEPRLPFSGQTRVTIVSVRPRAGRVKKTVRVFVRDAAGAEKALGAERGAAPAIRQQSGV